MLQQSRLLDVCETNMLQMRQVKNVLIWLNQKSMDSRSFGSQRCLSNEMLDVWCHVKKT
jgi:hypothetical protein